MLVVAISFLLAACPAVVGHYCCATIAAQEENTEDNGGISVIVAWAEGALSCVGLSIISTSLIQFYQLSSNT